MSEPTDLWIPSVENWMDKKHKHIEMFIAQLKGGEPYVEAIFLNGGCYTFHLVLKFLYPAAVPLISATKDHVITKIDRHYYDITGAVCADGYAEMSADDVVEAEKWSFSRNHVISLGECKHCAEPIIY